MEQHCLLNRSRAIRTIRTWAAIVLVLERFNHREVDQKAVTERQTGICFRNFGAQSPTYLLLLLLDGFIRRFDLTAICTDLIQQPASFRTPRTPARMLCDFVSLRACLTSLLQRLQ
ncbi:hypothetical protein F511_37190 [Dorcoceras hygrometricum]|uniref:Uncharacterized protein n=1 Tax=Dorcoceras hygrometricum TaxID=472368 RepID=A0A2Z7CUC9_9LAMI|nr:hypothetical protein F511_37190 [Dorcoceras hygrometricum]